MEVFKKSHDTIFGMILKENCKILHMNDVSQTLDAINCELPSAVMNAKENIERDGTYKPYDIYSIY